MSKKTNTSKTGVMWLPQVWWVPIIVALIGLGVIVIPLIFKQDKSNQESSSSFQYSVRVQAKDTGVDILNARVTIEVIGQAPLDEITDSNGLARIFVDNNRSGQPGKLIVQVDKYSKYTQNIDLLEDILPDVIQLDSAP